MACSSRENVPSNVLSESKMKSVLWDVMRVQFLAKQTAGKDSTININAETKALTEKVFTIHKITAEDFDKSYNWYTSHPDKMQVMLDSLYTQKQREFNPPDVEPQTDNKGRRLLKPTIDEKPISHE